MWYVYARYIRSGKEDFIAVFDTEKEAVIRIAKCYLFDEVSHQKGEYYYFMKKH